MALITSSIRKRKTQIIFNKYNVLSLRGRKNASKTIFDSVANSQLTVTGDITQNNFTPFKSDGYSFERNNITEDCLFTLPEVNDSLKLTIEYWIRPSTLVGTHGIYSLDSLGTNYTSYNNGVLVHNGINVLNITTLFLNWTHIAEVYNNNTYILYLNGSEVYRTTYVSFSVTKICIASRWSTASTFYQAGTVSNFRVSKDVIYTTNFSLPTSKLTRTLSTLFIAGNTATLTDVPITISSSVALKVVADTPFSTYYDAGSLGGSGIFKEGAQILAKVPTIGNGDFTFECWFYDPVSMIFSSRDLLNNESIGLVYQPWLNKLVCRFGGYSSPLFVSEIINCSTSWNHVAVCRKSGVVSLFVNGKLNPTTCNATTFIRNSVLIGVNKITISDVGFYTKSKYTVDFVPSNKKQNPYEQGKILQLDFSNNKIEDLCFNTLIDNEALNTLNVKFDTSLTGYCETPYTYKFDWWKSDYTINVWINPNSYNSTLPNIVGNMGADSASQYWGFGINNLGKIALHYYSSSGTTYDIVGTSIIPLSTWTQLSMVFSKTNSAVILYVNKVLENSAAVSESTTYCPMSYSAYNLTVGKYNGIVFDGLIEDLVLARTADNSFLSAAHLNLTASNLFIPATTTAPPPPAITTPATNNDLEVQLHLDTGTLVDVTGKHVVDVGTMYKDDQVGNYGNGSLYQSTGSYIPIHGMTTVFNNDFTIETDINFESYLRGYLLVGQVQLILTPSATGISIELYLGGVYSINHVAVNIALCQWYHIIIKKINNHVTISLDGNQLAIIKSATHLAGATDILYIGYPSSALPCNLNEFKITKNIPVQSITTPATDGSLELQLHLDNTTIFDSTGNHTVVSSNFIIDNYYTKFGNGAVQFNSSTSIVVNTMLGKLNSSFVISTYVRFDTYGASRIFDNEGGNNLSLIIVPGETSFNIQLYVNAGTLLMNKVVTLPMFIDTWYLLEVTKAGMAIGVAVDGITYAIASLTTPIVSDKMRLGNYFNSGYPFLGSLSEFKINTAPIASTVYRILATSESYSPNYINNMAVCTLELYTSTDCSGVDLARSGLPVASSTYAGYWPINIINLNDGNDSANTWWENVLYGADKEWFGIDFMSNVVARSFKIVWYSANQGLYPHTFNFQVSSDGGVSWTTISSHATEDLYVTENYYTQLSTDGVSLTGITTPATNLNLEVQLHLDKGDIVDITGKHEVIASGVSKSFAGNFGNWSVYDKPATSIVINDTDDLFNGYFSLEVFISFKSYARGYLFDCYPGNNFNVGLTPSATALTIDMSGGSLINRSTATPISLGTWYKFGLKRDGEFLSFWLNDTKIDELAYASSILVSSPSIRVGNYWGSSNNISGSLNEFTINKNFTNTSQVTTPSTDTNYELQLHLDLGAIVDVTGKHEVIASGVAKSFASNFGNWSVYDKPATSIVINDTNDLFNGYFLLEVCISFKSYARGYVFDCSPGNNFNVGLTPSATALTIDMSGGSLINRSTATPISLGTWYKFGLKRDGEFLSFWLNDTKIDELAYASSILVSSPSIRVGNYWGGYTNISGSLNEFTINKNLINTSQVFTPSTDTNYELQLHLDLGAIVDVTGKHTVVSSSPSKSVNSKFGNYSVINKSTTSIIVNNTDNICNGEFLLEFYINFKAYARGYVFDCYPGNNFAFVLNPATTALGVELYPYLNSSANIGIELNTWYRIALKRSGSKFSIWLDGIMLLNLDFPETTLISSPSVRVGNYYQGGAWNSNSLLNELVISKNGAIPQA